MNEQLRLMAILAHPDDESLGIGGTLATYAARGVETYLLTATRGQRGRFFDNANRPTDEEVGRVREKELRAAARELGVHEVSLLDYVDGSLDKAEPRQAIAAIAAHIRRVRPQVVVTFDPFGVYGHPDHIAISQFAGAAVMAAADASAAPSGAHSHRVSKLYYFITLPEKWRAFEQVFKVLVSRVDGEERGKVPWVPWSATTEIDARAHIDTAWRAIRRHETQMAMFPHLDQVDRGLLETLLGTEHFYRVLSHVNGGRALERDLFEGIAEP